jgi:hypothetical protein
MKDYLTMKEASLLIGRTPKTIKNYIKRGLIKNFFLVEGKYGQEYKISVRDLEPLGITCLEVLRDDYTVPEKRDGDSTEIAGESADISRGIPGETGKGPANGAIFVVRYEELVIELAKCRHEMERIGLENKRLKQDGEEKDMLIQVLMKKNREA